jgi:hypothetical protein
MDTEGQISLDDCAHVVLTFGATATLTCKVDEEIRYVTSDSSGSATMTEVNGGIYGTEGLTAATTRTMGTLLPSVGVVGKWKKAVCTAGVVVVSVRSCNPRAS